MPKEVIRYSNEYVIRDNRVHYNPEDVKEGEEVGHDEQISLHWSKGDTGQAQLAVQLDAEMVRRQLAEYDKPDGVWRGEDVLPGMLIFYTGPLKRYEMQRLIKHVRHARDDVHGADE